MDKRNELPMNEQVQNDDKRLKALDTYVRTNFPEGCNGIICRYCIFYRAGADTVEDYLCEMLYGIIPGE